MGAEAPANEPEQARFSALFSAIDIVKQLPVGDGADPTSRTTDVLAVAGQLYEWLKQPGSAKADG